VDVVEDTQFSEGPVTPLAKWRRRTAAGVVLSAVAIGLQEALEGEREIPSIVQPAPGAPPDDEPIDLYLDPDHPEATVAVIRPWLLR
jgi:hypothetical protein